MTTRKVHRTAQIKPATRDALAAQFAAAADEIISLRRGVEVREQIIAGLRNQLDVAGRRWWRRFAFGGKR